MNEHANAGLIRRFYEALGTRDAGALLALFDEDVCFHVPGHSPIAGDHRGIGAVAALGMRVANETDGTWKTEPITIIANDRYAASLHRWTAERKGIKADMRNIIAWRLTDDGKIAERWELVEDEALHDRFWSA